MKTKNNIQKACTKMLAIIFSLILAVHTINAQVVYPLIAKNNRMNPNTSFLVGNTNLEQLIVLGNNETSASKLAEVANSEMEGTLDLEKWMLNENHFYSTVIVEDETESEIVLEDWMIGYELFQGKPAHIQEEKEKSLVLENWMTKEILREEK